MARSTSTQRSSGSWPRHRLGLSLRAVGPRLALGDGDVFALDQARVSIDGLTITEGGPSGPGSRPAMFHRRIAVEAKSSRFEFENPMAAVNLSALLSDATVEDSRALNSLLPENATFALDARGPP